jgi:hypothetical protein
VTPVAPVAPSLIKDELTRYTAEPNAHPEPGMMLSISTSQYPEIDVSNTKLPICVLADT